MKKFKNPWAKGHKRTLTTVSSMKRTEEVDYDRMPYAGGVNSRLIENASFQNSNFSIIPKSTLNSEKTNIPGKLRLMLKKGRIPTCNIPQKESNSCRNSPAKMISSKLPDSRQLRPTNSQNLSERYSSVQSARGMVSSFIKI